MFYFGKQSKKCLKTCHPDLILIHETAIKLTQVDYGIHEGGRTFKEQLDYFLTGKSKIDPRQILGKHVICDEQPKSMATDIHIAASFQGQSLAWDKLHLSYVVGLLMGVAGMLFTEGRITHLLRWGLNWDKDKVIDLDQTFDDAPHVELYKP